MDINIAAYLNKLSEIFKEIDKEYENTQKLYNNFSCSECNENCCTTVFYHYTLLENFYLLEGLRMIEPEKMITIRERAESYYNELVKNQFEFTSLKIMCPLNFDNLCCIYEYRPLICRIHGLPGILHTPHRGKHQWQGCKRFKELYGEEIYLYINRTPYYTKIATLEGQLKKELVFQHKYKKTITEMILDYAKD